MIDAKELRIGNYLQYITAKGCPVEVRQIQKDYLDSGYRKLLSVDEFEPIPLTEEWLIKFGFLYNSLYKLYRIDNFSVWHCTNASMVSGALGFYWYEGDVKVQNIHDLQNLYYAITKKELTINESHG